MQCLAIFINLMRKTTSLDFLFGSLALVLSAEFLSRQLIFLLLFGERISRNFLQKQASALFQNCRVKHTKLLSCVLRCLLLKQNYYMKNFFDFFQCGVQNFRRRDQCFKCGGPKSDIDASCEGADEVSPHPTSSEFKLGAIHKSI